MREVPHVHQRDRLDEGESARLQSSTLLFEDLAFSESGKYHLSGRALAVENVWRPFVFCVMRG